LEISRDARSSNAVARLMSTGTSGGVPRTS
jgi:hypothetical protein